MRTFILGVWVSFLLVSSIALDTVDGCKPGQASNDINLIDAECAYLEQQPTTPAIAIVVCEVLDLAGNIVQQFSVHLPADQAAAFVAAHPVKAGHKLPQGAKP